VTNDGRIFLGRYFLKEVILKNKQKFYRRIEKMPCEKLAKKKSGLSEKWRY